MDHCKDFTETGNRAGKISSIQGKKAAETIQHFNILQCVYRTLNSAHTQDGLGSWGEIRDEASAGVLRIATVD